MWHNKLELNILFAIALSLGLGGCKLTEDVKPTKSGKSSSDSTEQTTSDVQPPAVNLTSPIAGSILSGNVAIKANAYDLNGVATVEFFLDSNISIGADSVEPFEIMVNTQTISNGVHTLFARAKDKSGNIGASYSISVTVSNNGVQPTSTPTPTPNPTPTPVPVAAPSAPMGVAATADSTSQITVRWTDVTNETLYKVELSTNGTNFCLVASNLPANTTSFVSTMDCSGLSLSAGTTYYYRVQAFNGSGASSYSSVVLALTKSASPTPTPVVSSCDASTVLKQTSSKANFYRLENTMTEVTAPRQLVQNSAAISICQVELSLFNNTGVNTGSFHVEIWNSAMTSKIGGNSASVNLSSLPVNAAQTINTKLNWTANLPGPTGDFWIVIKSDGNFGAGGLVRWDTSSGDVYGGATYYGKHFDGKIAEDYYFQVFTGNGSTTSGTPTLTPVQGSAPSMPGGLNVTTVSNTQITLTWTDVGNETSYKITRSTDGTNYTTLVSNLAANSTMYQNTGLNPSTQYFYRVYATNSAGDSMPASGSATTLGAGPLAPSGFQAMSTSSSQINLSWTDNANNETGFKIERSTDNVNFSIITTTGANVSSYSNTGLSADTLYYYRVFAFNGVGDSSKVSSSARTQLPPLPDAATRLANANTVIQNKCLACHNNFAGYTTDALWVSSGYVVAKSLTGSKVYFRLSGANLGVANENMPIGGSLTAAEIYSLKIWIENMGVVSTPTPTPIMSSPTPTPTPTVPPPAGTLSLLASPRSMDRITVASILTRAFGPTVSSIIKTNILDRPEILGGPVDSYESIWTNNGGKANLVGELSYCGSPGITSDASYNVRGFVSCWESDNASASLTPVSSPLRQGQLRLACESIAIDTALNNNMNAIQYFMNQMGNVDPDSDAAVKKAYSYFYSTRDLVSTTTIAELRKTVQVGKAANFGKTGNANLEGWRILALNLCMAPGWQIY